MIIIRIIMIMVMIADDFIEGEISAIDRIICFIDTTQKEKRHTTYNKYRAIGRYIIHMFYRII